VIAVRLFDQARTQQGLAYATETQTEGSAGLPGYGYLMAMAEVKPQDGDKVLATLAAIAADLRSREISADELDRARRPRIEEHAAARRTNGYWVGALAGAHEDPARLETPRNMLTQLQAVTPAAIRQAAQRYLTDDKAWKARILPLVSSADAGAALQLAPR
jgi:zinc protease